MHVKPGKGGAFARIKMKNMISGSTFEETFRAEQKFEDPGLEHRDMQYLYNEGNEYHFLDQESYDQVMLNEKHLSEVLDFLKEQEAYDMLYFKGEPIAVTPPIFMELRVVEAPPGVKGDTAQGGGSKPITLETGLVVQAPLFIEQDDVVKVDTRTGDYIERVKK